MNHRSPSSIKNIVHVPWLPLQCLTRVDRCKEHTLFTSFSPLPFAWAEACGGCWWPSVSDCLVATPSTKEAERNGFGGLLFADFPDVDATTPEGELFINQMAAFAQFEARRISQRTKAGLAVAKSRGKVLGGVRAGQEASREASKAKADADAEKLRGILSQFTFNTKSLRQIADDLESAGVKTPSGKDQWHPSQVARTMNRLGLER